MLQGNLFFIYILILRYVSFSAFASLVGIPTGVKSVTVGLKISAIIAGIKEYQSIIKKRKGCIIKYYCWQNPNWIAKKL